MRAWLTSALLLLSSTALLAQTPAGAINAVSAQPYRTGQLTAVGLHHAVSVVRDAGGVAHITAQDTHDLFFAQGFVAAQDHMWQMEMWRRAAEGRLAEVLGPEYVNRDRFARLLEFHGDWQAEELRYSPEGPVIFSAYAEGVNCAIRVAIDQAKIPVEFQKTGTLPVPSWTPHTMLAGAAVWGLSASASAELARVLGAGAAVPATAPKPAAGGVELPKATVVTTAEATLAEVLLGEGAAHDKGVSSMVQLVAPGYDVTGMTAPGLPGVSGVAEGLPVPVSGGQELVVAETDPADSDRYKYKGQWLTLEHTSEVVQVKGKPVVLFAAKRTAAGPVIYEDKTKHLLYALRWVGAGPGGAGAPATLKVAKGKGTYLPAGSGKAASGEVAEMRQMLEPALESEGDGGKAPFERVQVETLSDISPVVISWADYDNDGWPDMLVAYTTGVLKVFHNDHGVLRDVTATTGLGDYRHRISAASWGDFDGDGNLDLYLGYAYTPAVPNKLFRGDGKGHFVEVGEKMGLKDFGETRQVSFVDYNNDGRPDLYVAFRDRVNRLYRNDGDHFTEVGEKMGIKGVNFTVGAVWFDYNGDGRLDLFEASQNGKLNTVYRNDGDHFTNVAAELGLDGSPRSVELGSVNIAAADFNNDGKIDLYYANYGPSWLLRNDGGRFTDVAPEYGVAVNAHLVCVGWGDYDNDGLPDLYTDGYLVGHEHQEDFLFHNEGDHFGDRTPGRMLKHDGDHAVVWVDYDKDGALDLTLADHEGEGTVSLYHNTLGAEQAHRSLEVMVVDAKGHATRAGSEVRLYKAGTRTVLGGRLVDTSTGYNSQSVLPVHFGLGKEAGLVDVEVTFLTAAGRKVVRVAGVRPAKYVGGWLVVKAGE